MIQANVSILFVFIFDDFIIKWILIFAPFAIVCVIVHDSTKTNDCYIEYESLLSHALLYYYNISVVDYSLFVSFTY